MPVNNNVPRTVATNALVPFSPFLNGTPVVPDVYWDIYSNEQRLKWICCNLFKLIDYDNEQTKQINENTTDIDSMQDVIDSISNGEYTDKYIDGLAIYIDDNLINFIARIAHYMFPQLIWDGGTYRYSVVIPQTWNFLHFKWVYDDIDNTYKLTLNY